MLLAGEVGKPHGLQGEVYVVPISDDPRRFAPGSRLVHSSGRELTVEASRSHGTRLLVKFDQVNGRAAAEMVKGSLYVQLEGLRELEPPEYWHHEIVGCRVESAAGEELGRVTDVLSRTGQDLLVVATARGERFVPMVEDIVLTIDPANRRIVVDPPKGLLE